MCPSRFISRIKMLETNLKNGKLLFLSKIKNLKSATNIYPQIVDGDPFSTVDFQKPVIFRVWVTYSPNMSAPATSLKSATLWGSCCLKTTLVVFVAKNCWFYQYMKKIGTTNENWLMRQGGGNICCRFFATEAPPPIWCQFVILLKSCSWKHMWGSNSIFKNCRKSRFLENLRISDWFRFESSPYASGTIFDDNFEAAR